ncbi:indole-3-glycerol phosphate synthase TrpC [Marinoscillum furvescens]|uniref:Indole-3-glycerol phosphate synthase n=1 Tax=Marinoscillum furvescens DSM 4134 TaxID=1122208 RepID=A0A3D9L1J0_MARFU|nr:indole-3-glycerol phosphate synthase TrpC [Marinoscillum furvescens]RED97459.1 indole-3-glycerol phosphate synthase [Marinoscillum furvescens DSM 4134]
MNILDQIIADKQEEVAQRKSLYPVKLLEQSTYFTGKPVSLKKYVQREDKVGIIAEFKRQSPSKGVINGSADIERTSIGYMQAGASGLSVLTDTKYFGGKNEDLTTARSYNFCPILRKDFIIDEYQIVEAKSIGADVILLIAAALSPEDIKRLGAFAHSLGMEVLLEVHNEDELQRSINEHVDLLGVNNRNLQTFTTDINTSKELAEKIPSEFVKVSESGINDPEVVVELMKYGFEGFLIGEYFMHKGSPEKACREFVKSIKALQAG